MNKRIGSSAGLLTMLAVLLHLFGGSTERSGTATPLRKEARASSGSAAQEEAATTFKSEGPWIATQTYFHREASVVGAGACRAYLLPTAATEKEAACQRAALLSLYGMDPSFEAGNLETLIATVPDPLHTRMSVETDRYLDAIQQAAYRSHWELANQWLPWVLKANAEAAVALAEMPPHSISAERLPGLLVFRQHFTASDIRDKVLLVFVVGETPTAGINGFQFNVARRSIELFGGTFKSGDASRIALAGPNFSGSFPSLTELILSEHNGSHFEIRAGSVSNSRYAATLLEALREKGYDIDSHREGRPSVSFHGSTLPSEAFRKQFVAIARSWHYAPDQLADLSEDESGFSYDQTSKSSDIVTYRYPRDIAQLRNAYSDIAFSGANKQSANAAPSLDFSLKDMQSGEDTFPIFSSNHTPVSQNAVIEQMVRALGRQKVRLVTLTATNVFDTIFLAKVLARYCPDIRVVLSGADLLFVQEAVQGSLTGLLAISPFPLFADGSNWNHPGRHDVTAFADADSVGVFNAALTLLQGNATEWQPYEPVLDSTPGALMSAWLLVLGRSGWMPVKLLPQTNPEFEIGGKTSARWFDEANRPPVVPELLKHKPLPKVTQGWTALSLLVAMLTIGFCARLYYLQRHPYVLVWSSLCLSDLIGYSSKAAVTEVVHYRYVCLLSCLGMLGFTASIFLSPLLAARFIYSSPVAHWPLELLLGFSIVSPFAIMIWLFVRLPFRVCRENPGTECSLETGISGRALAERSIVVMVPIAFGFCWWSCCTAGVTGWLLCFRTLALTPPVCPLWPLLLVALGLFGVAFFHLRRFTWADRQQPFLDTTIFDQSLWDQFSDIKEKLDSVLLKPAAVINKGGVPIIWLSVLAAVALTLLLFPLEALRSFEQPLFEDLLAAMLMPLCILLGLSFVQFAQSWAMIRAFLVTLRSIVLGRFFTRLPDFYGSGPVWIREVKVLSLATSVNSSIALHNLQRSMASVKEWHESYWAALTRYSSPKTQRTRRQFIDDYAAFRKTSGEITAFLGKNVLAPYWANNEIPFVEETETKAALPSASEPVGQLSLAAAAGSRSSFTSTAADTLTKPEPITDEAYQLASKYVVFQYASFLGYALRHLQNLLYCCTIAFALLVLAMDSFSFQSPQVISQFLILALGIGAAVVIRVLAQIEKDSILSRLSGTEEGAIGKDFYVRALAYGGLPVLTVIGTQFPAISRFISTWAQPTLDALH